MKLDDFAPITVMTTSDSLEILKTIAQQLIEEELAACVQISGQISSFYRWNGNVENSSEWACNIKTSLNHFEAVRDSIFRLHNYDEPEIIATPILAGSEGYLDWLKSNLK